MVFFSMSVLVSAAYAMRTISLLFTGPVKPQMQQIEDLRAPELFATGLLAAGILFFGLLPGSLIGLSTATIARMHTLISHTL